MTANAGPANANSPTVRDLRRCWKPHKERLSRVGHPLPIRMHRAFSWLAQAERLEAGDRVSEGSVDDDVLILRWVAFNALYGRWNSSDAEPVPDRQSIRQFLKQLYELDRHQVIAAALQKDRSLIEQLCTDRYVHKYFWKSLASDRSFHPNRSTRKLEKLYQNQKWRKILEEVIERVYLVRCQLIHGAATHGSGLNRNVVRWSGTILERLLKPMIEVVIQYGATADWGDLCYPPLNDESRPKQPR